mmetsp:Transcript_28659/g.41661  ORF Transcript_28659/g.41661 Transcript_28659/m.41661 type:complete len:594 (+) Transcript_28659:1318-3099(+)
MWENVFAAKKELTKAFEIVHKKIVDHDSARQRLNYDSVSFLQCAAMTFGCGFILKSISSKHGDSSEENMFGWHSVDDKSYPKPEAIKERRYWNIVKNPSKSTVNVFVNRGSLQIFSDILRDLLAESYDLKVKHEKIVVSFLKLKSANWRESFSDYMSMNGHYFAPEHVGIGSLPQYFSEGNYSLSHWNEIWSNLNAEWIPGSIFWCRFCHQIEDKIKGNVSVIYVPSRSRFEIFARDDIRTKAKDALIKDIAKMCLPQNFRYHQPEFAEGAKWEKWGAIAKLGEIRIQYPTTRFCLFFEVNAQKKIEPDHTNDENDIYCNTVTLDRKKSPPFTIIDTSTWTDETDFERLENIMGQGNKVKSLLIMAQSSRADENLTASMKILERNIPSKAAGKCNVVNKEQQVGGQDEHSICCMCRRNLVLRQSEGKPNQTALTETSIVIGWRLTLCGCVFCRQCFLNSVQMKMKHYGKAMCQRCDTSILASDCENIIKFKRSKQNESSYTSFCFDPYNADWNRLAVMSIANFCYDIENMDPGKKCHTCLDCRTVTIHKTNRPFFYCRNNKCPNIMCSICGNVPLSSDDIEACRKKNCAINRY